MKILDMIAVVLFFTCSFQVQALETITLKQPLTLRTYEISKGYKVLGGSLDKGPIIEKKRFCSLSVHSESPNSYDGQETLTLPAGTQFKVYLGVTDFNELINGKCGFVNHHYKCEMWNQARNEELGLHASIDCQDFGWLPREMTTERANEIFEGSVELK